MCVFSGALLRPTRASAPRNFFPPRRLDGGTVAEFAHPHELLEKPGGGIFAGLVEELGPDNAAALRATAREAWAARAAKA